MQSKVRIYARVLHEVLKGASLTEQKKRIRALKGILKKRGDIKISHGILQEFWRLEQEQKGKTGKVVSARQLSPSVKAAFVSKLKPMKFTLEDRIDPSVIGGVALFLGNDFLIDNTILARLRKVSHAPL
jgi:F0F1-type ATP synthase delta subunit